VVTIAVLLAAPWLLASTALPRPWLGQAVLLAWGAGGIACAQAWRERPHLLWLTAVPRPLLLDGRELEAPRLHVRGPWLQLCWREGNGTGRLLFWPDQLDARQRRELRLAVRARPVPLVPRSVAP